MTEYEALFKSKAQEHKIIDKLPYVISGPVHMYLFVTCNYVKGFILWAQTDPSDLNIREKCCHELSKDKIRAVALFECDVVVESYDINVVFWRIKHDVMVRFEPRAAAILIDKVIIK